MTTTTDKTTQLYQVFIRSTPERVWEAITRPEHTARFFHGARITVTADGYHSVGPEGDVWGDGSVEVFDPPRRLVHEWRSMYDPDMAAEVASRVTWEIEPQAGGYVLLTVVHDRLEGAPRTADSVSGAGWMFVLSNLKTLLETGEPLLAG